MSNNPYLPDNVQQEPEQNPLWGAVFGMLLAMAIQAGLAGFLVLRYSDRPQPVTLAITVLVTWLISYVIGWAMHGQLFSERTLDPDKRQRWGGRGYHSASEHAQEGLLLAVLQFVCGALYTGVQALLGRRV